MSKIIIIVALFYIMTPVMANICYDMSHFKTDNTEEDRWSIVNKVLDAIRKVESQNGKYIKGKNGEIGPYQMKRIVIDDVNRIIGKKTYKYEDARNEEKARKICEFYILYWSRKAGCEFSEEAMARIWNGGPNGYKKKSTIKYWKKIKEVLDVND